MPRRRFDVVRPLLLMGGFLVLAVLFARLGPGRIVSLLSSLGGNFLIVVGLFSAHECVRSMALTCCLRAGAGTSPPLWQLVRVRFMGEAAGALTRTGSLAAEPARAWLLAGESGQGMFAYSAAIGELMANSVMSAGVNVGVAGWAIVTADLKGPVHILAHVVFWGSLVYASAIVGTILSRVRALGVCARLLGRLPFAGRWLRLDPAKVREIEQAIDAVFAHRPSMVVRVLLLEGLAQAFLLCEVYWAIRSMGVPISPASAAFVEVTTRPVSIVEVVGATEMGYAAVFSWAGMPAAVGFTLSLVKTVRSLTAGGIGLVLAAGLNRSGLAAARIRRPAGDPLDLGASAD